MILYHATTHIRGAQILRDKCLKKDVVRYYSEESGSNGPTTQGYIYLTNEITFSIYFANCHNLSEENQNIYIFRLDLPEEMLEPDEDEIKLQSPNNEHHFPSRLAWSLEELKSCRTPQDINISDYPAHFSYLVGLESNEILKLVKHVGYSYNYVITHYTDAQSSFLSSIQWNSV